MGYLAAQPFGVAALLPLGEVLLGDGASAELFFEEFLNVWQAVEPTIGLPSSPFSMRRPSSSRVALGNRAIFPVRVLMLFQMVFR